VDRRTWTFLGVGLVLALGAAGFMSLLSSDDPDGLERVSIDQGFDDTAQNPSIDTPLADYSVDGVENDGLATGLAGVMGVVLTLGLTVGILKVVQARRRADPDSTL